MKILRLVGLLVMLLALSGTFAYDAQATAPISCWAYCDNIFYSGQCWGTLAQCCQWNRTGCPDPYVFVDGDCTDGQNYCP